MGSITLPIPGPIYIDSQVAIYSVERRADFWQRLMPLWRAKQAGSTLVIRTSELTILESLVAPLRSGDTLRQAEFDAFFASGAVDVVPISRAILSEAARLRAATARLRTPDAIHAATALQTGCSTFLTNDAGLRNIPGVSTTYLGDVTP